VRKGRLTKKEKEEIISLAPRLGPAAIAARLGRPVEVVKEFLSVSYRPAGGTGEEREKREEARASLRSSLEWADLKAELTESELARFEQQFERLMAQLSNNVLPSEQTQLMHAIKLDILAHRNLATQKQAVEDAERIGRLLRNCKFGPEPTDEQREWLATMEERLAAHRSAQLSRTKEYTELLSRQERIMEGLKAVRQQRVKEIESGKVSFLGLIKMLAQREVAEKEGRLMALTEAAAEKELGRLSAPHVYMDGNEDMPILTAETLERLDGE